MGAVLTTQALNGPNEPVTNMMLDMGWKPGNGLGQEERGRTRPLQVSEEVTQLPGDKRGLGHF